MGISKTKSEMKTYDENIVKSSIEGKDINISSKENSVIFTGTDISAKNLTLMAKEDIQINSAEEKHNSSSKSSTSGLSVSASFNETPVSVTLSTSGAKGRQKGITYINSIIEVEEKLKTDSENLKISGANIEADKVDIKAKNVVIESKQDISERKDSSFGGSITVGIAPGTITLKDLSINGSKGKGESEWVNKQTTIIAKNGGTIEAENKLTNTGAVIASLSKNEKLKVSANEIEVNNLEDKDKYENVGAGISVGFDKGIPKIPNISVSHDKIDKEKINRATAINTEFTISGEEKSAEELGFNTELEKAQETTKDDEKHLNAKLHTDLLNKDERDKLKYAGKKINAFLNEANDTNKFKESLFGIAVDKYKDENQKQFNLIKDENLTDQQILKIATDIVTKFFQSLGYKGKIPEINLTNQEKSFSIDSLNKDTGEKRLEKVYFSIKQIRDKNLDFSHLMAHELAHMNTYNEGFLGEETALHTRKQLSSENKNKKMSEKEKADYLANIENSYTTKDISKMYEEANQIDESIKEYYISKEELAYRKQYMGSHISDEAVNAGLSFIFDLSPAGDTKALVEALYGKDLITGEELGYLTRIIGAIPIMNDLNTLGNSIKLIRVSGKAEAILNDGTKIALNATDVSKYENSIKGLSNISKSENSKNISKTISPTNNIADGIKAIEYKELRKLDYTLAGGYKASEIRNMSLDDFKKIGESSTEGGANFLKGNGNDAINMFRERVANVENIKKNISYYKDGTIKGVYYTASDKFGNKIVYRTYSSTKGSFHTFDLYNGVDGKIIKEIKFKE